MNRTTISVDEETRDALYYQKQPGESYNAFLRRICGIEDSENDGQEA